MVGPEWGELHDELLTTLKDAVGSYWQRFVEEQRAGGKPMLMAPIIEVPLETCCYYICASPCCSCMLLTFVVDSSVCSNPC